MILLIDLWIAVIILWVPLMVMMLPIYLVRKKIHPYKEKRTVRSVMNKAFLLSLFVAAFLESGIIAMYFDKLLSTG